MRRLLSVAAALLLSIGWLRARTAEACGACFSPPPSASMIAQIVTGHRMVMSIDTNESVLWDQFQYAGNPQEFSWVLPVSGDVRLEIASDAFFDQLERVTTPTVSSPTVRWICPGGGASGGPGCSCGFGGSPTSLNDAGGGNPADQHETVTIVSQQVVGPYASVVLRSTDANALTNWLRANGYSVPLAAEPTIAFYNSLHMDFLALRLRSGQGTQAMQPVRVRFRGMQSVLPLRMVGIGVGDSVAITLWVFARGRTEPANFASVAIDPRDLVWDFTARRSNYNDVFAVTLRGAEGGRAWITEYTNPYPFAYSGRMPPIDAGIAPGDGGVPTAELDWGIATAGWQRDVWVTRIRTNLDARFLDADLQLRAATNSRQITTALRPGRWRGQPPQALCAGGSTIVDGVRVAQLPQRPRRQSRPIGLAFGLGVPLLFSYREWRRTRRRV